MNLLLDTNVCVDLFRGRPEIVARLEKVGPGDCAISAVTAYELRTGILRCAQSEREIKKLERLLSLVHVLPFDKAAGDASARIRHDLEKAGCKIGPYDILIAGHAFSAGLTLVTNNTGEFSRITKLALEDWRQ